MYLFGRLEARLSEHFLFTLEGDYGNFVKFCREYSHISFRHTERSDTSSFYIYFQNKLEVAPNAICMDEGSYYTSEGTYYEIKPDYAFSAIFKSGNLTLVIDNSSQNKLIFHIIMIFVKSFSNLLFLHAAASEVNGKSIVFPSWGGAGKTHLLLALLYKGNRFIADDILVVDPASNTILPFQKTLNLLYYNLYDNRNLTCYLNLKRRLIFYQWILIKRMTNFSLFPRLPIILKKVTTHIEKGLRDRIGCSLDASFVSKTPIVDRPSIISKTFYLQRVNNNDSSIKIKSFEKDSFVQKMKVCLDREKSEVTNLLSRFSFASKEFRNIINELSSKEILKLQEFTSKNCIQILQYGLKVQPHMLIQNLFRSNLLQKA